MEEWNKQEQIEQATAWRMLLNALENPTATGCGSYVDILAYIQMLYRAIYAKIGDCPLE